MKESIQDRRQVNKIGGIMDKRELTFEDLLVDNYIGKLSSANHLISMLEVENRLLKQKIDRLEDEEDKENKENKTE